MKSDAQLQHDVQAELQWEPSVHAEHIGVEVKDGVVTLAGLVGSYGEKWNAERAAQRVGGLKALAVELKVRLPSPGLRSDADIARAVDNVITWTTALPPDTVHVMVENGWITLTGKVDWHAQRELVADSVRHLGGVTGLSNQLAIKARVSAVGVQADIEAALKRRASSEAQAIAVTVHGGAVTLTGTVHSASERQLATHAAWGAAGVASVIDQLTLVD